MLIGLAALAAAVQAAPAQAQPPAPAQPAPAASATPEQQDQRCLAAFAYLAGQPGEAAQAGRSGVMYYYGKLVGRNSAVDLAAALRTATAAIADRLQPELIRCSGELMTAGQAMRAARQALAGEAAPAHAPGAAPVPTP